MKTTISAVAVLLALVPSLAAADNISDAIGDAINGSPSASPSVNDALGDAINGPQIDHSAPFNDSLVDAIVGASPGTNGIQRGASIHIGAVLKCFVMGTPSEFPDDLRIRNAGLSTLPVGSELKWKVASAGEAGYVTLSRALQPGETLRLNGVLEGGVEAGAACSAKVL